MHIWQVQEAKAKLTQLINDAQTMPQVISRRGIPATVVISINHYNQLLKPSPDVVSFFRNSPLCGIELNTDRDQSKIRNIEL